MAAPVPLEAHTTVYMHQGDWRRLRFTILDGSGAAKDLTGVLLQARWNLYRGRSTSGLSEKTLGDGITIYDAPAGQVIVVLDEGDTASLAAGLYGDELRFTYTSGETELVAYGAIFIRDRRVGELTPV